MLILSDWNKKHEAYAMPKSLIALINKKYSNYRVVFNDESYNKEDVKFYFGNLPNEESLKNFTNLEWVHFGSIGIDKLSQTFIKDHSLIITNGAKTNTSSVVTYCLGEMFRSCKSGFLSRKCEDNIELTRDYFNNYYHNMIDYKDINLTILGYGDIGKELVQILSPMISSINIVSRNKRENFNNVKFYSLDEIDLTLKNISHLINVLPLHEHTNKIINEVNLIDACGFYYICAGRAETHSINAILDSINNGGLRGASLDVHGLPNGQIQSYVLENKKINLSPHISGWTKNFWDNQESLILYNLGCFESGSFQEMKNLIYNKGVKIK